MSILIYTTNFCPYCIAAKRLLSSLDLSWREISLDQSPDLRQKLSVENGGWRTVPMVFINGNLIGGYTELKELVDSGALREKVSA